MSNESNRDKWRIAVTAMKLPAAAYRVAMALSEFMDYDTLAGAHPGTALLVQRTGLAERSVKRAKKYLLEDAGVIERTSQGGWASDGVTASTYKGVMPKDAKPLRSAETLREEAKQRRAAHDAKASACITCGKRPRIDDEHACCSECEPS